MKKTLLASVLFAGACLAVSCSENGSNSKSSESPKAPAASRENLPKIVAFGDSLTAGYGLEPHQSYPSLLQQKLDADGFKYEVVQAGVSGETSAGGLRSVEWTFQGDVRFVILELGANDHLRGTPVAETKKNLSAIIEAAKARGAQVILAGMLTPELAADRYKREVADMYKALAREHEVTLIPFFLKDVLGVERLNLPDGVHPNAEGTKIVAETVYGVLKPMLEKDQR